MGNKEIPKDTMQHCNWSVLFSFYRKKRIFYVRGTNATLIAPTGGPCKDSLQGNDLLLTKYFGILDISVTIVLGISGSSN